MFYAYLTRANLLSTWWVKIYSLRNFTLCESDGLLSGGHSLFWRQRLFPSCCLPICFFWMVSGSWSFLFIEEITSVLSCHYASSTTACHFSVERGLGYSHIFLRSWLLVLPMHLYWESHCRFVWIVCHTIPCDECLSVQHFLIFLDFQGWNLRYTALTLLCCFHKFWRQFCHTSLQFIAFQYPTFECSL